MAAVASSGSTLWATASKEWVIQPKPKPGRKPKKESTAAAPTEGDEVDNKGRRVQNRAAQRAFRERKQSQLAELQARVQQYEQGEIERNVALQNIAKRLKDENDQLRKENTLLKERVTKLEGELGSSGRLDKKRGRDDSPLSTGSSVHQTKRMRSSMSALDVTRIHHIMTPDSHTPSMVSSPDSGGSPFSPIELSADPGNPVLSNYLDFPVGGKTAFDTANPFTSYSCGLCNENTPCVCRELSEAAADRMIDPGLKVEPYDQPHPVISLEPHPTPSILDNLPAYQPAVPLRRRNAGNTANSVFPVAPSAVSPPPKAKPANCSGDPSNCLACADDSFGKAFCAALGKSIAEQSRCGDCPCGKDDCSSASASGSSGPVLLSEPTPVSYMNDTSSVSLSQSDGDMMPTNAAWQQLKHHPNVAFADLSLLADVVARRSKCTGPRVVISPGPGAVTPEKASTPARPTQSDSQAVLLTDPHAHYRAKERERSIGSPPRLVPQDVLIQCGQQRIREVQAAGVRDALRLLDAKFS